MRGRLRWTCISLLLAGACDGSSDLTSPLDQPRPMISLTGPDVVRAPADPSFLETGRTLFQGKRRGQGCEFPMVTTLPSGRMRTERFIEIKPSTCQAVLASRDEPFNQVAVARESAAAISPGSDLLKPSARPNFDLSPSDPGASYSSSVSYAPGGAYGYVFQKVRGVYYGQGSTENENTLTMTFEYSGSCITYASAINQIKWRRNSPFSWGIMEFLMPYFDGNNCGTFEAGGSVTMGAGGNEPCLNWEGGIAEYNTWVDVNVGTRQFGYPWNPYFGMGSCTFLPERYIGGQF